MIKSFVDFLDESPKSFDELYRKLDLEPSEPIRDQYQFNEPTTKLLTHISKKLKEEGIIEVQNFFSNEIISELFRLQISV